MNRILFLGMDLSGKSHNSYNVATTLVGEESILVKRLIKQEKIGSDRENVEVDILRHIKLYNILNAGAKANIVYDTTNDFIDIKQIEKICKERCI